MGDCKVIVTTGPIPFHSQCATGRGGAGKGQRGHDRHNLYLFCGQNNVVAAIQDVTDFIGARCGGHFECRNIAFAVLGIGIGDFLVPLAARFGERDEITAAADLPVRSAPGNIQCAASRGWTLEIDCGRNRRHHQILFCQYAVVIPVQNIAHLVSARVDRCNQFNRVVFTVLGIGIGDFRADIAASFGKNDKITATADLFVRAFPDNLEGFTHFNCIGGYQAGFYFANLNGVSGQNIGMHKGVLKSHFIGAGFGGGGHCRLGVGVLVGVKIGGVIIRTVAGFGHRNDIALVGGRFPFHIENGPDRHLVRGGDVKCKLGDFDRLARQYIAVPCRGLIA